MRLEALRNCIDFEMTQPDVATLRFSDIRSGWEQWFLLTSDLHDDSALSARALMERHAKEAVERDALILTFGDALDAMQMPMDKRQSKNELRAENMRTAYLDSLVERSGKRWAKVADRWPVLGMGNHESAMLAKHGTNLTDRLAAEMRRHGGITQGMGYDGWVRFMFDRSGARSSQSLYFHHGSGGAAPMSHGTLDTRRLASWTDADVICQGHTHTNYVLSITRRGLTDGGVPYSKLVDFVRIPGYKHEGGWEKEKGMPPKPRGAVWMRLFYYDREFHREYTPTLEA